MQDVDGLPQEDLLHLHSLREIFGGFSHEMAQPLNAIMIASQVIQLKVQRSSLPDEEKRFFEKRLDIVSSQVQRATHMLESLRSFSDEGTCYPEETTIREIFQRVFEFMRTQFLKRGIDISVDCYGNLPRSQNDLHIIANVFVQVLAYARDSVEAIAQWHERRSAPYEKAATVRLSENHGASAMEIEWALGNFPADGTVIDPKSRMGLVAADLALQAIGGVLHTSAGRVVTRIP